MKIFFLTKLDDKSARIFREIRTKKESKKKKRKESKQRKINKLKVDIYVK